MTEPKPEIQPAGAQAAANNKSTASSSASSFSASKPAVKAKRRSALITAFVIVLLLAIALAAALWYQQYKFRQANALLSSQAQSSAGAADQAGKQAQQALSLAQSQSGQISALQASLAESQVDLQALEQSFQILTDSGSDLAVINDVDHLVEIAHQQLALSGNVGNGIIALETAQAQLARANRPSLAALQQAINGDLDRLRAVSTVDIAQLSSRLDELNALVSKAPLLVPDDAAPTVDSSDRRQLASPGVRVAYTADPAASWWKNSFYMADNWVRNAWSSIREDLGSFISVRRVQDSSALLLSPDQAGQLRENLRLRIMTAQLALMMRQPEVWKSETSTVLQAVQGRFDVKAADSQRALKLAQQLAETSIQVTLPTVRNSMQTLEALRQDKVNAAEQKANPSSLAPADSPRTQPE